MKYCHPVSLRSVSHTCWSIPWQSSFMTHTPTQCTSRATRRHRLSQNNAPTITSMAFSVNMVIWLAAIISGSKGQSIFNHASYLDKPAHIAETFLLQLMLLIHIRIYLTNGLKLWYSYCRPITEQSSVTGSDHGLSPGRCQAIIWTNVEILLTGPLRSNCSEILIEFLLFSFTKRRLKVSSAKWRPFCFRLNVLMLIVSSAC